eukprot:scaffold32764_cov51-Isochrysis_galbana.AAC.1
MPSLTWYATQGRGWGGEGGVSRLGDALPHLAVRQPCAQPLLPAAIQQRGAVLPPLQPANR